MINLKLTQKILYVLISLVLVISPLSLATSTSYAVDLPNAPQLPGAPDNPDSADNPLLPGEEDNVGSPDNSGESNSDPSENSGDAVESSNNNTGADSENTADSNIDNDTEVDIDNDAQVDNVVGVDANTGDNNADENTGDGTVNSGEATIEGTLETDANTVSISDLECSTECDVVSLADLASSNYNTGADSENTSNSTTTNTTSLGIDNDATLNNQFLFDADSGDNSASLNTGNGTITSGDAEVILTAINTANNINVGYDVFNVYDDQTGDLIIDFNSISGGTPYVLGGIGASNNTTGADSDNSASSDVNNTNTILIDNDGNVINNYLIDANTGDNTADKNTGDGSVTSGDANIVFNLINFLNNAMLGGGEILLGVANIFGTLSGDIVIDGLESGNGAPGLGGLFAGNDTTGAGSDNDASSSLSNDTDITLNNDATVLNNVSIDANTGDNTTDRNTGDGSINSGDADANLNVANIANNNVIGNGGDVWMVLINNLGSWTGQLFGGDNSVGAYSPFFTFTLNPDGSLSAENQNTGADSENEASTTVENNTDVDITNTATLTNNVTLDANTGNNSASKNTGSGSIQTGDAGVAANIVNILNNTFLSGRFALTIVNIFGSFFGDIRQAGEGSPEVTVGSNESVAISQRGVNKSPNLASQGTSLSGSNFDSSTSEQQRTEESNEDKDSLVLVAGSSDNDKGFTPIARFGVDRGLFDDFKLVYLLIPIVFGTFISLSRRVLVRR
jgi:hypothetical protein